RARQRDKRDGRHDESPAHTACGHALFDPSHLCLLNPVVLTSGATPPTWRSTLPYVSRPPALGHTGETFEPDGSLVGALTSPAPRRTPRMRPGQALRARPPRRGSRCAATARCAAACPA